MRKSVRVTGSLLLALLAIAVCHVPAGALQVEGSYTRMHTVKPGDIVDGLIVLVNTGASPESVRITRRDRLSDDRIGTRYLEPGEFERSNAPWIEISQDEVLIPAGQQLTLLYRIHVPEDQRLSGTYWSALVIEPQATGVQTRVSGEDGPAILIRQVVRHELMIITQVADTGDRQIEFVDPQLQRGDDGRYIFHVLIENTGERLLNPKVWLELYDESGRFLGRFERDSRRIFPQAAVRQQFDLGVLEPGAYPALLIVDAGDIHVFGARYTLRIARE